jgi:hypothetical protein
MGAENLARLRIQSLGLQPVSSFSTDCAVLAHSELHRKIEIVFGIIDVVCDKRITMMCV